MKHFIPSPTPAQWAAIDRQLRAHLPPSPPSPRTKTLMAELRAACREAEALLAELRQDVTVHA
jgi:hypothetical protein